MLTSMKGQTCFYLTLLCSVGGDSNHQLLKAIKIKWSNKKQEMDFEAI